MSNRMQRTFAVAVLTGAAFALTACQSSYRAHAKKIDAAFAQGNYAAAADIASQGAKKQAKDETERVIYYLEAARTAQVAGDPAGSRVHYEAVYADIRPYLDTKAEAKVTEAVVTTAVNQTMATYKATPGERIMCNSLNALNCLAMGDRDAARLELNRAHDWQMDAKNRYAKEMEQAQAASRKKAKEKGVEEAMNDGVPRYMGDKFNNLQALRGYADYQNPFANHLRGVYYMACGVDAGDLDKARHNLRQALAMNPDCAPAVESDLAVLEGRAGYGVPATTWVYIMSGRAPRLDEFKLNIPIPVGKVRFVSAAFPELKTHEDHVEAFYVEANGKRVDAVALSNIDGIVGSEFQVRLPTIIGQEIASSAGKAAVTWALRESQGNMGQLMGMIYQAGSTAADLRTWRTLPKQILLCRIPTPGDGAVKIGAEGGRNLGVAKVAPDESNIVVITLPSAMAPIPAITTAQLTGEIPQSTTVAASD